MLHIQISGKTRCSHSLTRKIGVKYFIKRYYLDTLSEKLARGINNFHLVYITLGIKRI